MILNTSKIEQTRFGKRYGNLPKRPSGGKTEGNPSAGFASKPPMAAARGSTAVLVLSGAYSHLPGPMMVPIDQTNGITA